MKVVLYGELEREWEKGVKRKRLGKNEWKNGLKGIVIIDEFYIDFREKIGGCVVMVVVIFNGYVDVIIDGKFVMLEEWWMEMLNFLDIMEYLD